MTALPPKADPKIWINQLVRRQGDIARAAGFALASVHIDPEDHAKVCRANGIAPHGKNGVRPWLRLGDVVVKPWELVR